MQLHAQQAGLARAYFEGSRAHMRHTCTLHMQNNDETFKSSDFIIVSMHAPRMDHGAAVGISGAWPCSFTSTRYCWSGSGRSGALLAFEWQAPRHVGADNGVGDSSCWHAVSSSSQYVNAMHRHAASQT